MKRTLFSICFIIYTLAVAQKQLVFVYFKDKPNKAAFYDNPTSELTQKSLDRRKNLGISLNDQDAPVEQAYIQKVRDLGFIVNDFSKWLNGVTVYADANDAALLRSQNFIKSVESFALHHSSIGRKTNSNKQISQSKFLDNFNYGFAAPQTDQLNLRTLHEKGYTGKNISIAVIDTGFPTVNTGTAFARMRSNGHIKGGYNFISKNADIYNLNLYNHGTVVLGTMGGFLDGLFVGSAPDADFYLYCSEIYEKEIPEEMVYWVESAEEADRKGVNIITTSLGYSTFDDPQYDMTYSDMNGKVSIISKAAQIALEKGIFVLVAAGNSGVQTWKYIMTPADNENVFAMGAVDDAGVAAPFSSYGPNADGKIKPDASSRGVKTQTVYDNNVVYSSGTSLSTPLAAGGVACLLQALPKNYSRVEIANQLRKNASLYPSYTYQMGYGILNFGKTLEAIKATYPSEPLIYPNPSSDQFQILSPFPISSIEMYDASGRLLQTFSDQSSYSLSSYLVGTYYLKIKTENEGTFLKKIIKK